MKIINETYINSSVNNNSLDVTVGSLKENYQIIYNNYQSILILTYGIIPMFTLGHLYAKKNASKNDITDIKNLQTVSGFVAIHFLINILIFIYFTIISPNSISYEASIVLFTKIGFSLFLLCFFSAFYGDIVSFFRNIYDDIFN